MDQQRRRHLLHRRRRRADRVDQSRPPPLQNPHQVEYDLAPLVYHQNIEIEIIFSNTQ